MAYNKTLWKDRIVEKPNTYRKVENTDGTITLYPVTGQVIEKGTPVSAANLNKLENGIVEVYEQLDNKIDLVANKGTTVEVIERVTKEEIDRQIEDGTIANLTIAPGSITADRLDPNIEFGVQIDDSDYSSDTTWSSEQIKNMLDAKMNSDVMDNILIYPQIDSVRAMPRFKYNKRFSWTSTLFDGGHCVVVVVDVSKYIGQSINLSCDYLMKINNQTRACEFLFIEAIDNTTGSYINGDLGKTWNRLDRIDSVINSDGYCQYNKTYTVNKSYPFIRLTFMDRVLAPVTVDLSFNIKVNNVAVTPVAYGGFFTDEKVTVSNIGGSSSGGGNPILPPSTEGADNIAVDGTKVLLSDGYMLDGYLKYIKELMDNVLIYPSLCSLKNMNNRALPSFKYNKKFSWNKSPMYHLPHSVVVLDTTKYKGQSVTLYCEYVYKENNTLMNDSQIIITSAVDNTVNSYKNVNGGPQWTRIDRVFPALTDGYCKYEKTLTVDNDKPYIRLAFTRPNSTVPTNINLSLNIKINNVTVTPVAYGGFFEGDEVTVTNIGGSSSGGGNPILPPSTEGTDNIAVDGTKVLLSDGYALENYLSYLKELIDNIDGNSSSGNGTNALNNKVWAIMGDSISNQGMYAKTHYYKHIADRNPGLIYNASQGISGTRIAKRSDSDTQAMCYRYRNLASNANIITVFGGVNDWGQPNPTPLGEFTDTTEVNSFYGALHSLCKNLIQKYPNALIMFITPMSQKGFGGFPNTDENSLGFTVLDYGNAIIEVCGNYGIPVLDLGRCGGMTPKIPEQKTLYYTDGLHLNDKGQEKLSYLLERELLRYI